MAKQTRTRRRQPQPQPQQHGPAIREQATIRCSGKQHRLALDDKGEVLFLDHDEQKIQRLLHYQEIGGTVDCECVQMLNFWRDFCSRKCKRCRRTDFRVTIEVLEAHRAVWRAFPDLSTLYSSMGFVSRFVDGVAHDACGATGAMQFRWGAPSGYFSSSDLYLWEGNSSLWLRGLNTSWMRSYFRGLGVVDGFLVLAPSVKRDGGWRRKGSRKFECWTGPAGADGGGLRVMTLVRDQDGYHVRRPRSAGRNG